MEINWYEAFGLEQPKEVISTGNTDEQGASGAGSLRSEESPHKGQDCGADLADGDDFVSPSQAAGGQLSQGESQEDSADTEEEPDEDDPGNEDDGQDDAEHPDAQDAEAGQGGKKPQSREENSKFAAARRKAERERDAAIQAIRNEEAAKRDRLIAGMGLTNPYTNQPITTEAEYAQYQQTHAEKTRQSYQMKLDMSEDEWSAMVAELPEVKEARKLAQDAKQQQMQAWVEQEIAQITKLNPAIRTAEDLANDPRYDQILKRVDGGSGIYDAYRLEHFDELSRGAGRQAAINAAGKSHMGSTKGRGNGGLNVPADELRWFRDLNPRATDEQIRAWYNKRHKQ